MKDLYARAGLQPYESDKGRLQAALQGSSADNKAARYVLLHDGRRQVYDRTHATLTDIGIVRAALGLNDAPHWRETADFTRELARGKSPTSSTAGRSWGVVAIGILIIGSLYWVSENTDPPLDTAGLTAIPTRDVRHVSADTLNVRTDPSPVATVLGQLHRYDTVDVETPSTDGDWAAIRYQGTQAYVAAEYLAAGDGRTAEVADCFKAGTTRPFSGHILERSGASGEHVLTINASVSSDAMVKLKNPTGATLLSMYVRAGETASVNNIPDGEYRFEFATGDSYGPSCGRFLSGMQAFADDEVKVFTKQFVTGGYNLTVLEYTLYDVASGNFRPTPIDSSDF